MITHDEIFNFIKECWIRINPNKQFGEKEIDEYNDIVKLGFLNFLTSTYYEDILINPSRYDITIIRLIYNNVSRIIDIYDNRDNR